MSIREGFVTHAAMARCPAPRCGEETGANQGHCISCGYQIYGEGNPPEAKPEWTMEPEQVTERIKGRPPIQGSAQEHHDEMIGSVHAVYDVDHQGKTVVIGEWTSAQRGQGNTNQALAILRERYPGYRIAAFDVSALNAEDYWRHQREQGRIDDMMDDSGTTLSRSQSLTDYRAPHPARTLPQGLAHLRPTYGDAIRAAEQAQARVSER
jgi:hypothetical protein